MGALTFTAPAQAAGGVVVRGTGFPAGSGLAHVGCERIFDAGAAPQPYVDRGPAQPPLGERSLGFDLAGGDAAGPVRYVSSLAATTTASLAAYAPGGTTGVAWAGYAEPGQERSGLVWFGQAPLSVPAGGWSTVQAADLTYEWAQYDMATGEVVAAGPTAGVADFAAAHGGTGAGLWALTLGCDGRPFHVDAFSVGDAAGTTTYDLEGLETALSIAGRSTSVVSGESVRIDGTLSATGETTIPRATGILERRTAGTDGWEVVRVIDAAGGLSAFVEPPVRTDYRWRFVDRPLAEASTSPVLSVDVARQVQARVSDDGGRVVGSVTPYRAGIEVTVRAADGSGPFRSATTDAQGDFTVELGDLPTGSYVASTPATALNLRGESGPLAVVGDRSGPRQNQSPEDQSPETEAPTTTAPEPREAREDPEAPTAPKATEPTREPKPEPTREPSVEPTREPDAPAPAPEPTRSPDSSGSPAPDDAAPSSPPAAAQTTGPPEPTGAP